MPRALLLILLASTTAAPTTPSSAQPPAAEHSSSLIEAAREGDVARIERAFLSGQDLNQTTDKGQTALHVAAAGAKDDAVAWLIAHEANVFARDKNGETPA